MSYEPDWRSKSGELCEIYEEVKLLKAENEKLRAVVDIARAIVNNSCQAMFSPQLAVHMLKEILGELDEP